MSEFDFLEEQGVSAALIKAAEEFRQEYGVSEEAKHRRIKPALPFYGKETLEMAMAAVLEQENLLLAGPKATGKNVLAENLAYIFGRPVYNVSFHVNTNSGDLIGTDTFVDNQVKLRKGSIYQCAEEGGFGILDEINMAKNDAVSVLHATLDYRRSIDVPGYDKIDLHPAARFIGTMNYGYAGTKELNEALVSRFLVIDMPAQNEETLGFIFNRMFPDAKKEAVEQFMGVFLDLQQKSMNSEISTKPLDLRGLLAAMKIVRTGLSPWQAVRMGIVNKTFDVFEKEIVEDVVRTRIPLSWTWEDVYEAAKKLNKDGVYGIDLNWDLGEGQIYGLAPIVWSSGAELLSKDGKVANGYINSPEAVEALTYYQKFATEGLMNLQPLPNEFEEGKAAMYLMGSWEFTKLNNDYPDFEYGVTYYPASAKTKKVVSPSGDWC